MARPAPRLHRLPHRRDYTLIPAPLDLTLPLATEKSPLPAIIVTPSSPSSTRDFSIAFLAPPEKPSLKDRFFSFSSKPFHSTSPSSLHFKARSTIIILLLLFILVCHVATHRLASRNRPHLDFAVQAGTTHIVSAPTGWFNFWALFGVDLPAEQVPRDFIVTEVVGAR